jgi:hypothetical protein
MFIEFNHVSGTLKPLILGLTLISIRGRPKTRHRGLNLCIGLSPSAQTNSPLAVVDVINKISYEQRKEKVAKRKENQQHNHHFKEL